MCRIIEHTKVVCRISAGAKVEHKVNTHTRVVSSLQNNSTHWCINVCQVLMCVWLCHMQACGCHRLLISLFMIMLLHIVHIVFMLLQIAHIALCLFIPRKLFCVIFVS